MMVLCIAHIQTDVAEDAMSSAGRCPCGLPISLGRYRLLADPPPSARSSRPRGPSSRSGHDRPARVAWCERPIRSGLPAFATMGAKFRAIAGDVPSSAATRHMRIVPREARAQTPACRLRSIRPGEAPGRSERGLRRDVGRELQRQAQRSGEQVLADAPV